MIKLSLEVVGIEQDQLVPVEVEGVEELSTLYAFDVSCRAPAGRNVLGPEIVGRRAKLTIALDEQDPRIVQGAIVTMTVAAPVTYDDTLYRLRISPGVSRLRESRHNHIYGTIAPVSLVDVLRAQLSGELRRQSPVDDVDNPVFAFDLRLLESYPEWDHLTQYEETDFEFLSRLCEHFGVFYFFESAEESEQIVFTDCNLFAPRLDDPTVLPFSPDPASPSTTGVMRTFEAEYSAAPHKVYLQDYNEELPNLPLLSSEVVDPQGRGNWVEYGAHYRTPAEGAFLARVRAEEVGCRRACVKGTSTAARLAAGRIFQLSDHPFSAWNKEYITVSVRHHIKSAQVGLMDESRRAGEYHNEFMAIPRDAAFRPPRRTPRPRIGGLINGRIEGSSESKEPHLDHLGRYRVRLLPDLSATPEGFGSQWVRKIEPYGGANNGMHFPLPPGANVLVAFVNGDPDRPVIVGASSAADNLSVVTGDSRQHNRITTRSGIVLTMTDQLMKTGAGET
jgi:type VI secretion system VgrG family protein